MPDGSKALQAMRDVVSDPYFLERVTGNPSAPDAYQIAPNGFAPSYQGPVAVSLSRYALNASLELKRGSSTTEITRPYGFTMPDSVGSLEVHVKDENGHEAKTVTVFAP